MLSCPGVMVSARKGQYCQHFKESCNPLETAQFSETSAVINISNKQPQKHEIFTHLACVIINWQTELNYYRNKTSI